MGLKKRAKVSAEFSMSSLTDIIFLLLIFFMLTSTLVAPNAINFNLPGSTQKRVSAPRTLDEIRINNRGNYYYNNKNITLIEMEDQLRRLSAGKEPKSESVIISIDKGAKVENVVAVMDLTLKFEINRVLAPEK
ncbi:ExbD/TolR family protein [Lewinella sp. LCG006]|uniref:ExbD/TolR family protein n=1 Tax=Lewinella sp. LCG006 TaxID=3231911 RepID=UPI0034604413